MQNLRLPDFHPFTHGCCPLSMNMQSPSIPHSVTLTHTRTLSFLLMRSLWHKMISSNCKHTHAHYPIQTLLFLSECISIFCKNFPPSKSGNKNSFFLRLKETNPMLFFLTSFESCFFAKKWLEWWWSYIFGILCFYAFIKRHQIYFNCFTRTLLTWEPSASGLVYA